MAINIKDPRTDRLARELAEATGESITTAVAVALTERLDRVRGIAPAEERRAAIMRIAAAGRGRPILDDRSDDEILGYDEHGLPS